MKRIRQAKWAYVLLSLCMIALGFYIVFHPGASLLTICYLTGAFCILFAVAKFIGYFSRDAYGLAFQFDFALGIFALVLGILLLFHPGNVLALIQFITGLFILIDSVFKFQTSLDARRFGLKRWWSILLAASLSAIAGIFLLFNPFGGAALMILVGIALIVGGLQNLVVVLYTVKYVRRRPPDDDDMDVIWEL